MKKNFSFRGLLLFALVVLAAMLSSCSKSAYKKTIPADAPIVVELDIKNIGLKSDFLAQKDDIADLILSIDPEDADQRLDDLTEIAAHIATTPGGLGAFLDEVALMTNLDARAKASLPADHMHLTTVHQAKGMEWPVVILPWLADTVFPSARSIEDGNDKIDNIMRDLTDPPSDCESAYETLQDLYPEYQSFASLATDPSGSYTTYTQKFEEADSTVSSKIQLLSTQIPDPIQPDDSSSS